MGQLNKGSIELIQNEEDAANYQNKQEKKIAYITQTTLSVDDKKKIINILNNNFPEMKKPMK